MSVSWMCASLSPVGGTMYPVNQGTSALKREFSLTLPVGLVSIFDHILFSFRLGSLRNNGRDVPSPSSLFSLPAVVPHQSLSVGYIVSSSLLSLWGGTLQVLSSLQRWICLFGWSQVLSLQRGGRAVGSWRWLGFRCWPLITSQKMFLSTFPSLVCI